MSSARIDPSVRAAVPRDVPVILSLIRELAEYERLSDQVRVTQEQLAHWLFGARPAAEALIGELEGQTRGFALFFQSFSTFLGQPGIYLEDLYVQPDWRGHGLGATLLKALAQIARERRCGRLEWAVLDWNEPAIGFYQSFGAKPMSQWTTYRVEGEALDRLASHAQ